MINPLYDKMPMKTIFLFKSFKKTNIKSDLSTSILQNFKKKPSIICIIFLHKTKKEGEGGDP